MSKFDEILNSSNPSDALLGEQIDKTSSLADKIDKTYVFFSIFNKYTEIDLEDYHAYIMVVQIGSDAELYTMYTSSGEIKICKLISNLTTSGVTKLTTVTSAGLSLHITPVTWVSCSIIALNDKPNT